MAMQTYYEDERSTLILGDAFEALASPPDASFYMVFADPPYSLSNDGISNSGGRQVIVNKGEWDRGLSVEDKHEFNRRWIFKNVQDSTPSASRALPPAGPRLRAARCGPHRVRGRGRPASLLGRVTMRGER